MPSLGGPIAGGIPCEECGHSFSQHSNVKTERYNVGEFTNYDEGGHVYADCLICKRRCEAFSW